MIMLHELWISKKTKVPILSISIKMTNSIHIHHADYPTAGRGWVGTEREREMSVSIWQGNEKDVSVISRLTDTLAKYERAEREKEWDRGTNIAGVRGEKKSGTVPIHTSVAKYQSNNCRVSHHGNQGQMSHGSWCSTTSLKTVYTFAKLLLGMKKHGAGCRIIEWEKKNQAFDKREGD